MASLSLASPRSPLAVVVAFIEERLVLEAATGESQELGIGNIKQTQATKSPVIKQWPRLWACWRRDKARALPTKGV